MVDTPELIDLAKRTSVQIKPEVTKEGGVSIWGTYGGRGWLLPAFGTRSSLFAEREWYRANEQSMVQGAFTGLAKGGAALPWEIKGDDSPDPLYREMGKAQGFTAENGVEYWQEVLRRSNFGEGWGEFYSQGWLDYLRYDTGWFAEIIAPGNTYEAITDVVVGLAHLDPLRCIPTGDPVHPVIYYDRWGGLHVMHFSRVLSIIDSNDGDDLHPGYGMSALRRAIAIMSRQAWSTRYINARLDDEPPPGIMLLGGVTKAEWYRVTEEYKRGINTDQKPVWGKQITYHTADPAIMPKIETYQFQQSPEKYDFRTYTDIDVDMLALVMNVDRQELMQLSGGGAIGSEGQSVILHQKSKGKTIGYMLAQTERKINDLLPDGFAFTFKQRDTQEEKQKAEIANLWAGFTAQVKEELNPQERKTLLASQNEAVQDAISDAPRANDIDITPESTPINASDDTAGAETVTPAVPEQPPERLPDPTQKVVKYDPNQPRADDGKFGSGGGGIGAAAGIARDSSGQPEYIPAGHNKPLVKNPYYSGKPSSKPAPKPADKPAADKPDKKPEADKPASTTPKPAAGKKPTWTDPKRKPGIDEDGYNDFAGMDNDKQAVNRAYDMSEAHTGKMSKGQREAAETYTGGDYSDINGGLRKGKVPREYQKTVRELDSAIDQSSLPDNTVLYRGMNASPEMRAKLKPGATFSDSAYTSTSINPRIPDSFARGEGKTLMRIKAPKGQKALAVNNVSNFDGEHEVLLPRGTGYKITNVYTDKKTGLTYIDAEIIGEAA